MEGRTKTHLVGKFERNYFTDCMGRMRKLYCNVMLLIWVIREW